MRHGVRHAACHASDSAPREDGATESGPVVIDPSDRNRVADVAACRQDGDAGEDAVNDAATTVISQDELQAYFARFAAEANAGDADEGTHKEAER